MDASAVAGEDETVTETGSAFTASGVEGVALLTAAASAAVDNEAGAGAGAATEGGDGGTGACCGCCGCGCCTNDEVDSVVAQL